MTNDASGRAAASGGRVTVAPGRICPVDRLLAPVLDSSAPGRCRRPGPMLRVDLPGDVSVPVVLPDAQFALRHPRPAAIWPQEGAARRQALLDEALTSPDLLGRFALGTALPAGYGAAMDERVVEWPWLTSQGLSGRLLDAGSCLNHPEVLARVRPLVDEMHILTLEPEAAAYPQLRISYVFADLRELPYRDAWFDCVDSISTLEHVG